VSTARLHASDVTANVPWLAFDYVPGRDLRAAGIAHRDIKPGNAILAPEGPKIVDFGIATEIGADRVTGRDPYGQGTADELRRRAERRAYDVDGVPDPLRSLVVWALAPDPADRPRAVELIGPRCRRPTRSAGRAASRPSGPWP
jgi:hypothetical protein